MPANTASNIIEGFNPSELILVTDKSDPLYDPRVNEKPDPALVENIRTDGFNSVILVTPRGDGYAVVAGRRRTKAAIEAGALVTIKVVDGSSPSAVASAKLGENLLRKDLTPIQMSDEFSRFLSTYQQEFGVTAAESKKVLAEKVGRTVRNINEILELQNAAAKVRTAVDKGLVTMSAITSRGAGLTQMLTDEGAPDAERQEKKLEKMLQKAAGVGASKATRENSARENGGKPLGQKALKGFIVSSATPKAVKALVRFILGEVNEATLVANAPWYAKYRRAAEGPGWEPEGEIQDLDASVEDGEEE